MVDKLIKLIFPPKCIFCNNILSLDSDIDICEDCYKNIPFLKYQKSSAGRNIFVNRYCDDVVCVCEYTGIIKEALVKFKFYNRPSFYRALGKLLYKKIAEDYDKNEIDLIISVPLSKKRFAQRGYNQARFISKALSREIGAPDCSDILRRVRHTASQRSLDRKDRHKNIQDAFSIIDQDIIIGKTIILVDDIYTTGSTTSECARVLKESGAEMVIAAVVASGRKY